MEKYDDGLVQAPKAASGPRENRRTKARPDNATIAVAVRGAAGIATANGQDVESAAALVLIWVYLV